MPIVGTTIDAEEAKTKANAEAIAHEFLAQTKHRELDAELRRAPCDALDSPGVAAVASRLFDLTIVPIAPQSRADRELAEAVVFGSGRPVLLLPPYWAVHITPFDRPLIAWDCGARAERCASDASPRARSLSCHRGA